MTNYVTYLMLAIGTMVTFVLTVGTEWSLQAIVQALMLLTCLGYLTWKAEGTRRQLHELHRLQDAYNQLDQQAKLVIRTDLELHRAQEELDRRLASLMSLHGLGRQLQVSLHPEEVYSKLDTLVVTNFGFSKGLVGLCASLETLEWRSLVGVDQLTADRLKTHLLETGLLKQLLTNPGATMLHVSTATPSQRTLLNLLGVPCAVIAGVLPHAGPAGYLLLGRAGTLATAKADEELVSILANQLAAAVENSALYEKAWNAQQELERKVQDRTRELAEANTALMQLNKAKSDFVSAVSHELRTPLAAIKGYASLLGTGQFGTLAVAQHERIAKIEKHADLLTQFINNLLDIARIESRRVTMEHRPIALEEFLTSIQDVVLPQMQAKHLQFQMDRDGVNELVGDPQQLQRVFVNLLSNAIKYTPEGGMIRFSLKREAHAVVAAVTDTGCGISEEDLPKLFQEFYRSNDSVNQQIKGTGLGLALVKRIVEAHQGRIWVTSTKGRGSTFFVTLPAG